MALNFPSAPTVGQAYTSSSKTWVWDGTVWQETWNIVEASDQEISDRLALKTTKIRNQRNYLLQESDWSQVADAPVNKQAWAAYRQQLRDVTRQIDFPWEVTWPEKPE